MEAKTFHRYHLAAGAGTVKQPQIFAVSFSVCLVPALRQIHALHIHIQLGQTFLAHSFAYLKSAGQIAGLNYFHRPLHRLTVQFLTVRPGSVIAQGNLKFNMGELGLLLLA